MGGGAVRWCQRFFVLAADKVEEVGVWVGEGLLYDGARDVPLPADNGMVERVGGGGGGGSLLLML